MAGHFGRGFGIARYGVLFFGASILLGCGPATQYGATDADFARGRSQASQGADVYAKECARCHGQRGEGLAGAPPVLGQGALPTYPRDYSTTSMTTDPTQLQIQQQTRPAGAPRRDPFRTASDLYNYVNNHLPKSRAAAMQSRDYWDVVAFVVAVQGAALPQGGLDASSAGSVQLPQR
jgi:cytochrome c